MGDEIPFNFGGLPEQFTDRKKSKIVVLPVSFDKTTTWLKGSDKGPDAIIDASRNMELYDIETNSEVCEKGIFTEKEIKASSSELMIKNVYEKVKNLLNDRKFVVILGGEHSVSIGAVKVCSEFFKNMSVLHLDAHTDMRDSYEGTKYSHACAMARVKEVTKNIVSVGIRSMDSSELGNIDKSKIFYAEKIHDSDDWIKKAVGKLSQNVYVSIDLDVFDPGIMPSTGTPEPGGLDWYQVTKLLRSVAESKNIVGFDVVELCPSENNKAPDFLAAKLIYKLLSYKFSL
jgi:agmatinase